MRPGRVLVIAIVAVASGLGGPQTRSAGARPGVGSLAEPTVIDALPYAVRGTTVGAGHAIDGYGCAAAAEAGGERVYRLTLARPARVSAWISDLATGVDVDVHWLDDLALSGRLATGCVARGDTIAEADLAAGERYLVIDTFASDARAGGYVLHVDAVTEAWSERTLATGVTWRARRTLSAPRQVEHEVVVDLAAPGVTVRALAATGCQSVSALGTARGAIAGVNGGYFDGAGACAPVSLLKASGLLLGRNASASARGAFGISGAGVALVKTVATGADWPEAFEAHGGGPVLALGGVARSGAAAWAAEGLMAAAFLGANPRTLVGSDGAGRVHLGTVDGRRTSAAGMSLDALAAYAVSPDLGLIDAVNLDGGGSSTMWIAGATPTGVVNYPSDGGDTPAHAARQVSGGFYVFAPPYDHPPRFQTQPATSARVGVAYGYDADALDLDVDDVLSFRLEAAPAGFRVDASSGVVSGIPSSAAPDSAAMELVVSDGRGAEARQRWLLSIEGGQAGADAGAGDPAGFTDAGPALDSDPGCSCALGGHRRVAPQAGWWLLAVALLGWRARRSWRPGPRRRLRSAPP